jgi:hypothetical protein
MSSSSPRMRLVGKRRPESLTPRLWTTMPSKFKVGDVARLPDGSLRTIVAMDRPRGSTHVYYAFRISRSRWGAKSNLGPAGPRSETLLYWLRSDKLGRPPPNVEPQRTGRRGRPRLRRRGRPRMRNSNYKFIRPARMAEKSQPGRTTHNPFSPSGVPMEDP